ncbi:tRNA dihydrouridine(20/20a) synthase DusA [Buchnera aphidicola]|uniref:tRNA dihydrouridine(20/20a) synthase DusA n=1 Tax=Buchnera aphidicola TaxID=9 RepID=UPI003464DAAA
MNSINKFYNHEYTKKKVNTNYHRFSIAPMLNYTDKDCRYFYRQMTKKSLLYTEMITTNSILNKKIEKLIYNRPVENPISIQLAGRNPIDFAKCAQIASMMGYNEINLNIGCPSINMQKAGYGVCLMKEPHVVISCINAIDNTVNLPISIKIRTGVDDKISYFFLKDFINKISTNTNCKIFIIHARAAWLLGINTRQNRNLPKLQYHFVYQIKQDFPHLKIVINGGINSLKEAIMHLSHVDGVMLGRAIYKNPSILTTVDQKIFYCKNKNYDIIQSIKNMLPYIEKNILIKKFNKKIFKHMSGAFYNSPGSQIWKKKINALQKENNIKSEINKTLALISILYN